MRKRKRAALSEEEVAALQRIIRAAGRKSFGAGAIVSAARPKSSPLHARFEWNDAKAAAANRLHVARDLLERFRIIIDRAPGDPKTKLVYVVPGVVSVGDGYRDIRAIMGDPIAAAGQVAYEWARIDSLLARLAAIASVSVDYAALAKWCETVRVNGTRMVAASEPASEKSEEA
jgi:hypothetical protein